MELKLKEKWANQVINCPFTGKIGMLKFLDPNMYIHYFNNGYAYLFEDVKENKKNVISK